MRVFAKPGLVVAFVLSGMGAARAETMPQLDFANPLLTAQVVWGGLIFAVFYLLVSRWGLPRVGAILETRAETIARDLERAHAAKRQADRAVADLTAARNQAYATSQAEIAEAMRAAKALAQTHAAEQESRLDAQLADSEAEIGRARDAAMGALRQVASEAAMALVNRLVGEADEARVQAAVVSILHERGLAA